MPSIGDRIKFNVWISPLYVVFFLWAGVAGVATSHGAQIVDRIVAVVNDDIITLTDLEQTLKPYLERVKSMGYDAGKESDVLAKLQKDMLNRLIDQKLTDQEIKKAKLEVSNEDLDSAIERLKEKNFFSDEDFSQDVVEYRMGQHVRHKNYGRGRIVRAGPRGVDTS